MAAVSKDGRGLRRLPPWFETPVLLRFGGLLTMRLVIWAWAAILDRPRANWQKRVSPAAGVMSVKIFFLRFFTWWNGQTFGTQLWTWLYGEAVGTDEYGNRYYRTKGGKIDPSLGFERRWVIYNGYAEASTIPPAWHGWMHHTVDVPPTQETAQEKVVARPWWKPHRPNMTGTPGAHRPTGSTLAQGRRPKATGDYKAWTPR